MNIAFFAYYFPKLSETFIINQVTGLLDRGHEVTIFANESPDEEIEHEVVEEYDLLDRTVYTGSPEDYVDGAKMFGASAAAVARNHPRDLTEVLEAIKLRKDGVARLANYIAFEEYDETFDVCHAHFGTVGRQWEFVADDPDQGAFVTTCYGTDVTGFVHPDRYDWYDGFWEKCDLAIGITQYIRSKMIMLGCPERRSVKHPIGIKPASFENRTRTFDGDDTLRILSVARHAEMKGLKYAIDAVADCIEAGMDIQYRIAGDGERREELESRIDRHGVSEEVSLLGWVTQNEVTELLHDSHLFLLPSVTARSGDTEGQALVLQEAQATGLPVVATYHDGIPEGVEERRTGLLVPERDVESISEAIGQFAHDPSMIEEYSRNTPEVAERFDNESLIQRQEQLYLDAIDEQ
ncbi:glycosyltransferase [Halobaculum lipolyticum]|uniref:Glycosyltransferase n=1 Tax=Halobaculum lipolyticum TaxID=3032001 RepID=A0ABD5W7N8_9EURY|nr:glycosyltransferase [Halobaculum sp. DT31]